MEPAKDKITTGISDRLQPWQAIFSVFMYALGTYGIENDRALILYALILATLAFAMVSGYRHSEATKSVVAPWLLEKLLKIVSKYLAPQLPQAPTEALPEPRQPPDESEQDKIITSLRAEIKAREEAQAEA